MGPRPSSFLLDSLSRVSDIPAGWFPDPSGAPGMLRYWDGTAWTGHVHQQVVPAAYGQAYGTVPARFQPTTPDGEPLAGWWHRVGATALDNVFGAMLSIVISIPAQMSMQREMDRLGTEFQRRLDADDPHALSWFFHHLLDVYRDRLWIYLVPAVILVIAQAAFLHYRGGTPGQLITGLRTRLRERPGPLSWGRAIARGAAYLGVPIVLEVIGLASGSWAVLLPMLALMSIWGLLNPLWAAWDGDRQALHDKLVGTNVVRVRRD